MAEINKLSVGQALDKLRSADAPKSRMAELDGKMGALDEEIQRMRAASRRLERDQRAGLTGRDTQEVSARRVTKLVLSGVIIGIVIVIAMLAWKWGLF